MGEVLQAIRRARRLLSEDGKTEWIVLRPEDWQTIISFLEDLEDIRLIEEIERTDEFIPWEEAERLLEAGDVPD